MQERHALALVRGCTQDLNTIVSTPRGAPGRPIAPPWPGAHPPSREMLGEPPSKKAQSAARGDGCDGNDVRAPRVCACMHILACMNVALLLSVCARASRMGWRSKRSSESRWKKLRGIDIGTAPKNGHRATLPNFIFDNAVLTYWTITLKSLAFKSAFNYALRQSRGATVGTSGSGTSGSFRYFR
jgi:hypothetical protein